MAQERDDLEGVGNDTSSADDGSEESQALAASNVDDITSSEETENIKEQIEDTRNQMGETIDAIQDRLSFANISEQVSDHVNTAVETAKEAVYEATIGKVTAIMKNIGSGLSGNTIMRTAKNNPLPFLLIGVGAGLLAYNAYSRPAGGGGSRKQGRSKGNNGQDTGASGEAGRVSTALSSAYSKVDDLTGTARQQYRTYLQESPLAVGAAALAIGAVVGMAIPATDYENQLLGPAQENLLELAQDKAAGLIDRTKEVISDATRNAVAGIQAE